MAEKLPYKKPEIRKFESEEQAFVFKQFHNVDFEVEKFPDLYERLIEIHSMKYSHFKDAVDMADIVSNLWAELKSDKEIKLTEKKFKLACLFHDIGKSGPSNASPRQRFLIRKLFEPEYFNPTDEKYKAQSPRDLSINEALDLEDFPEKEEMKEYLSTLTIHVYDIKSKKNVEKKLDIKKDKMIDFWREHDIWTRDILKPHVDDLLDEAVAHVAGTHNALDGRNAWNIDDNMPDESIVLEEIDKYYYLRKEEVRDKSLILTLVDQYQAYIDRSGFTHDKAINEIKKYIDFSKTKEIINHGDKTYNKFIHYLGVIERHKELVKIIKPE